MIQISNFSSNYLSAALCFRHIEKSFFSRVFFFSLVSIDPFVRSPTGTVCTVPRIVCFPSVLAVTHLPLVRRFLPVRPFSSLISRRFDSIWFVLVVQGLQGPAQTHTHTHAHTHTHTHTHARTHGVRATYCLLIFSVRGACAFNAANAGSCQSECTLHARPPPLADVSHTLDRAILGYPKFTYKR